ncbi:MAG: prepilin peptidase [Desulfosoma sp.]
MDSAPLVSWIGRVAVFFIGCCLGSFYNVIIYRWPKGESIVSPPSRCPACGTLIRWYDNIPVVSFVLLRGRCRQCRKSISWRYPAVELLTGLMAAGLFRMFGWSAPFFVFFVFGSLLVLIAFIDLDTFLIPDMLSLGGLALGLTAAAVFPHMSWVDAWIGALLGGGFFFAVAWGYQRLRNQDGLGGGDIKLLAMIGAFIGWKGVLFTVFVSSVIGAAVGLAVMARSRQGLVTRLPFGPFLSLGAMSYVFWGERFTRWYFESLAL